MDPSTGDTGPAASTRDTGICERDDHLEGGGCLAVRTGCVRCEAPGDLPQCDTADTGQVCTDTALPGVVLQGGGGPQCAHGAAPSTLPLWWLLVGVTLRRALWVSAAVLGLLGHANAADVVRHENLDGSPIPGLVDPRKNEPWHLRAAIGGTTAFAPVQLRVGEEGIPVIEQLDTLEFGGSLQIADWFVVGVAAPIHRVRLFGGTPQRADTDLTAFARVPLTPAGDRHATSIEIRYDATARRNNRAFPIPGELDGALGSAGRNAPSKLFTATNSTSIGVVHSVETDGWWAAGRLAARIQPSQELPGLTWGSRLEGSIGGRRQLGPFGLGGSLRGSGPLLLNLTDQWPLEALGVAAWSFTEASELQLGGGAGLTRGLGAPRGRVVAAMDFASSRRDSDGDGYVDLRDLCPQRAEDRDHFRDWDGCPEADNDRDGWVDPDDDCPDRAEVINGWADDDGCPDALATWIIEVQAPEEPEQVAWSVDGATPEVTLWTRQTLTVMPGRHVVAVSAPGYREASRAVQLGEGETLTVLRLLPLHLGHLTVTLVSGVDKTAIGDGEIELEGTPYAVPAEGLSVDVPSGRQVVRVEAPGHLPSTATVAVPPRQHTDAVIELDPLPALADHAPVLFDLDSSRLTEAGIELVDALADWLHGHPEVQLLRVDGHADELGGSAYNLRLSQRRADAVVDALVERDIAMDRLQGVGSGEARAWLSMHAPPPGVDPVVAGQALREVQFQVLVWDDAAVEEGFSRVDGTDTP